MPGALFAAHAIEHLLACDQPARSGTHNSAQAASWLLWPIELQEIMLKTVTSVMIHAPAFQPQILSGVCCNALLLAMNVAYMISSHKSREAQGAFKQRSPVMQG